MLAEIDWRIPVAPLSSNWKIPPRLIRECGSPSPNHGARESWAGHSSRESLQQQQPQAAFLGGMHLMVVCERASFQAPFTYNISWVCVMQMKRWLWASARVHCSLINICRASDSKSMVQDLGPWSSLRQGSEFVQLRLVLINQQPGNVPGKGIPSQP